MPAARVRRQQRQPFDHLPAGGRSGQRQPVHKTVHILQQSFHILSLAGLTGPVYGAQLELLWNEPQQSALFTPQNAAAYSPRCLVQTVGGQTRVTVYLDLNACPTQGASPSLGTLQLGGAYTPPVQARITLLDRDLKPYANASGAWVGINNNTSTTPPSVAPSRVSWTWWLRDTTQR